MGIPSLLNKTLSSNRNNAETTDNDGILSVNTKGFVVGENSAGFQSDELNKSGKNYVTYCFNAGGNKIQIVSKFDGSTGQWSGNQSEVLITEILDER